MARLCRRNDFVLRRVRLSERDVFPHRAGLDPRILQHHAEILPQAFAGQLRDFLAGDADFASVHIVKAHEKVNQRRLAAARRTDNCHALARLHGNVERFNQRTLRHIAEADVCKRHTPVGMVQCDRVRRVRRLRRLVDQFKHAPRACHRVLQLGHDAGNVVEGLCVLVGIAEEDGKSAHCDAACHSDQRARERHAGIDDAVDKARDRICQRGKKCRAQGVFFESAVNFVKCLNRLPLARKCLHDPLAIQHLADQRRLFTERLRLKLEHIIRSCRDELCCEQRQRRQHHHDQRDAPIEAQHKSERPGNRQDTGKKLREAQK